MESGTSAKPTRKRRGGYTQVQQTAVPGKKSVSSPSLQLLISSLPYELLSVICSFLAVDELVPHLFLSLRTKKTSPVARFFQEIVSVVPSDSPCWNPIGTLNEEALFILRRSPSLYSSRSQDVPERFYVHPELEDSRTQCWKTRLGTTKPQEELLVLEPPKVDTWRDIEGKLKNKVTLFLPSGVQAPPSSGCSSNGPRHVVTVIPRRRQVALRLFPNASPWMSVRHLTFLSLDVEKDQEKLATGNEGRLRLHGDPSEEEEERLDTLKNCLVFSLSELLLLFPNLQTVAVLPPPSCSHIGVGRLTPVPPPMLHKFPDTAAASWTWTTRRLDVQIHLPPKSNFSSLLFVDRIDQMEDESPGKEEDRERGDDGRKEGDGEKTRGRKVPVTIEVFLPPPTAVPMEADGETLQKKEGEAGDGLRLPWWQLSRAFSEIPSQRLVDTTAATDNGEEGDIDHRQASGVNERESNGLFFATNLQCGWKKILRFKKYRSRASAVQDSQGLRRRQKTFRYWNRRRPPASNSVSSPVTTAMVTPEHERIQNERSNSVLEAGTSLSVDNTMEETLRFLHLVPTIGLELTFRKLCPSLTRFPTSSEEDQGRAGRPASETEVLHEQRGTAAGEAENRGRLTNRLTQLDGSGNLDAPPGPPPSLLHRLHLLFVLPWSSCLHHVTTSIVFACIFYFFFVLSSPSAWPPQLISTVPALLLWSFSSPMRSVLAMMT